MADRRPPLYVIDWLDHSDIGDPDAAWSPIADLELEPPICRTAGFVIKRTAKTIVITSTANEEDCSSPMNLLKSAIVFMQKMDLPPMTRFEKGKLVVPVGAPKIEKKKKLAEAGGIEPPRAGVKPPTT